MNILKVFIIVSRCSSTVPKVGRILELPDPGRPQPGTSSKVFLIYGYNPKYSELSAARSETGSVIPGPNLYR